MQLLEKPVKRQNLTPKEEIHSALYGLLRLIAGYAEWQKVEGVTDEERSQRLIESTINDIAEGNSNLGDKDTKALTAYARKLKAYQQLQLLETFCLREVDWTN